MAALSLLVSLTEHACIYYSCVLLIGLLCVRLYIQYNMLISVIYTHTRTRVYTYMYMYTYTPYTGERDHGPMGDR